MDYHLLHGQEKLVGLLLILGGGNQIGPRNVGTIAVVAGAQGAHDGIKAKGVVIRGGRGTKVVLSARLDDGGEGPINKFGVGLRGN